MFKVLLDKVIVFAVCSLVLAGCGSDAPATLPRLDSDARILAFGDSLTYGTGAGAEQAWPAVLSRLIDREVINRGTPGDETRHGIAKLPAALDEIRPDLLILCLGGNDFLRRRSTEVIRKNMKQMIQQARERKVPVLLLAVPAPAVFGLGSHELYLELAREYALPIENEILAEVLADDDSKADPIHPNARGYRLIAVAIANKLRAIGAI